ncbi:MAG: DNA repair protein RadA [Candidatus Kapabacteria bacterium]|nr:DNA repair protein RadA [Ignavibacteriota bacterium]MCW5884973.1 DNA repair protein RadA [Candidatus Kapabacteria bacterium]
MKNKSVYECTQCGAKSPKWAGKCNTCGAWNSIVESQEFQGRVKIPQKTTKTEIISLSEISTEPDFRIKTGINEFDRVLGGGIIPGALILIGGDPGIGKSTLMLQMCSGLTAYKPLYITGEESLKQIKYRSGRLSNIPEELLLMSEVNMDNISSAILDSDSIVIIIDSIQSMYIPDVESSPGSISQVRECANVLMNISKQTGKAIFVVGHVTKDGMIAGPKILEHTVDTVLQFEGEKNYSYRILRSLKNRFGSTNEIGIFEMGESGLVEVKNPSEIFLASRTESESGVAVVSAIEGTRPILLEVQSLVTPTGYNVPQRNSNGFDYKRLQMILAVLEKKLGIVFRQNDVFVNIAGGLSINDISVDLGIAAAICSSFREIPIDKKTVLIGEVGLTGEIRSVSNVEQRVSEAEKLGFERVILPKPSVSKLSKKFKIEIIAPERMSQALSILFG